MSQFIDTLIFRFTYTLVWVVSSLCVNVVQLLLYVFIKKFNRRIFYKILNLTSNSILYITAFLFDFWSNSSMIVYCTDDDLRRMKSNRMSLVILNHPTDFDFVHMNIWFANNFTNTDGFRGTMKKELSKLPGFGWMLNYAEHLFLDRDFDKDKENLKERLESYLSYENGFSLAFLPEGRIFSQARLEKCIADAKEKGQEYFRNLLIPKWRGYAAIVEHLKKSQKSSEILILNLTIAYDNVQPTYQGILSGESNVAHVLVKLVPLDQVEATKESLYKLYRDKDLALDDFKDNSKFQGENIKSFKLEKNMKILKCFVFWLNVCISFLVYSFATGYWKVVLGCYVGLVGSFELIFASVFRSKPAAAGKVN